MNLKLYIASAAAAVLGFVATAPAQAATLTSSDVVGAGCVGLATCNVNGFTLSAFTSGIATGVEEGDVTPIPETASQISEKTVGGILGVGVAPDAKNVTVANDPSLGEIDYYEKLNIGFEAGIVSSLQLSFMYQPNVYSDKVFEIAQVTAGGITGTLSILSDSTAQWEYNGFSKIINAFSPSLTNFGGSYIIDNPFFGTAVSGVSIKGTKGNSGDLIYQGSDLAFTSISVPEPGTVAALMGLAAVGGLGLRRRKSAEA